MAVGTLVIAAIGTKLTILIADPTVVTTVTTAQVDAIVTKAQLFAAGIVVGVGGLMGTIAGILRQLGLREEAMRRWKDVYIGTTMALTGPALVFLLATIVRFLIAGIAIHA